jgi:hypothetical protein
MMCVQVAAALFRRCRSIVLYTLYFGGRTAYTRRGVPAVLHFMRMFVLKSQGKSGGHGMGWSEVLRYNRSAINR